jgi:hypothetical protein
MREQIENEEAWQTQVRLDKLGYRPDCAHPQLREEAPMFGQRTGDWECTLCKVAMPKWWFKEQRERYEKLMTYSLQWDPMDAAQ